jgi:hypothetical protein
MNNNFTVNHVSSKHQLSKSVRDKESFSLKNISDVILYSLTLSFYTILVQFSTIIQFTILSQTNRLHYSKNRGMIL